MTDRTDIPDDEALAAEYVLRLLDPDEARAFEARMERDPALRAAVLFWEAEFAGLAEDLPEETPSRAVRQAVMAAVEPEQAPARRGLAWGWLALPGVLAVAVAAVLVLSPILREPAFDPAFEATLGAEDGSLLIQAAFDPETNTLAITPSVGAPAPGRDFELWIIAEGADAPVSLGVIATEDASRVSLAPDIGGLIAGGTLAVSDEPAGGSPTGAPTGPILAVGAVQDAEFS